VVIHDLNIISISRAPTETDPPLLVDSDAVLTFSVSFESFQSISRRYPEVVEDRGCIEHPEFSKRNSLDPRPQFLGRQSLEEAFGVAVSEALDHIV
jgi:hypothetical protein